MTIGQTTFQTLDTITVQTYVSLRPRPPKMKVVVQFLTPGDEISVSHFPSTFVLDASKMEAQQTTPALIPPTLLSLPQQKSSRF